MIGYAYLVYRTESRAGVSKIVEILGRKGVESLDLTRESPDWFSNMAATLGPWQEGSIPWPFRLVMVVGSEWELWEKRGIFEPLRNLDGSQVCLVLLPGAAHSTLPDRVPFKTTAHLTEEGSWEDELNPLIPILAPPQSKVEPIDISEPFLSAVDPETAV